MLVLVLLVLILLVLVLLVLLLALPSLLLLLIDYCHGVRAENVPDDPLPRLLVPLLGILAHARLERVSRLNVTLLADHLE